jgi:hypothetical protein
MTGEQPTLIFGMAHLEETLKLAERVKYDRSQDTFDPTSFGAKLIID